MKRFINIEMISSLMKEV